MITPEIFGTLIRHLLDFIKAHNAKRCPFTSQSRRNVKDSKEMDDSIKGLAFEKKSKLDEAEENLESLIEACSASDSIPQSLKA